MAEGKGLRGKSEAERSEAREAGRQALRSPALVKGLEWAIRALLGAILAVGRVLGDASPFGVALVGACAPGAGGWAALVGAAAGYLASRGLEEGLRYTAASILVFAVAFALWDTALCRKGWFMPAVAAVMEGITGLVTFTGGRWTAQAAAACLGEMALTAAGVYAFRMAFTLWDGREDRREATLRQRVGLIFLGLAILISLGEVELLGLVSAGRICACLAALASGYGAGPGAGAAVGVVAGLAMDLSASGTPFYAMTYGFGGLLAGLFRGQKRFWADLGFTLAGGLVMLWSWGKGTPAGLLYEVSAAGTVFLILPQRVLGQVGLLFPGRAAGDGGSWAAREAARRLRDTAGAFDQVFSALRGAFAKPQEVGEDPGVICDRAANRVCARCTLRERCWQTGYEETHGMLSDALTGLLKEGHLRAECFPQRFRDRCVQFPAFSAAVGEELAAYQLRRQYRGQVRESRQAVCGQYGDMAKVLEEAAEAMAAPLTADPRRTRRLGQFLTGRELRCQGVAYFDDQGHLEVRLEGEDAGELLGETGRQALSSLLDLPLWEGERVGPDQVLLRQREPLMAVAGVAGRLRAGETVTGDTGSWFKDEKGRLFLMLCDGMGSGPQAREDSRLAVELLEKFLRAGVTPENALKTLDQALMLRGEETGGFSTIDLLTLDLFTGQGVLYKLGAAPSYLKKGGAVTRLAGTSLPAGLGRPGQPDRTPFQVGPGDCLVLVTDGVLPGEDEWLRSALAGFDNGSPAALAEELVAHGETGEDDRTALVLRVGLRVPEGEGESA